MVAPAKCRSAAVVVLQVSFSGLTLLNGSCIVFIGFDTRRAKLARAWSARISGKNVGRWHAVNTREVG